MELGAFSVSLNVADVAASRDFYRRLGFDEVGGDAAQGWLILRNGACTLGLFKGMIPRNTLTFNPGWSAGATPLDRFEDVRDLQSRLKADGVALTAEADPDGDGPAHFTLEDPDGNPILVDQHVPRSGG